jgi:carboxymethylenebutenolidase
MASMIEISAPGGTAQAYLARPDDEQRPGVLLFMDAIGLRPQIELIADRIASWGYVVLAPNYFYRSGTAAETSPPGDLTAPGTREAFFAGIRPRIAALTSDLSNADTLVWLDTLASYAPGPVAATGYCMGARLAVRAAGLAPDVVRGVAGWHGGNLVTDAPDSPHRSIVSSTAYVFGHADNDQSMTPDDVARLEQALVSAGAPHTNEVFEGAAHGYVMADTSMHDEAAAERHYLGLEGLLNQVL